MSILYNPETSKTIERIRQNPPQSLLLRGVEGVGLLTAATDIAGAYLAQIVSPTDIDGNVDDKKGIIRIKDIRRLYEFVRGKSTRRRVVIIDKADSMKAPAQNAFLKLLEEPQENICFILTAHRPDLLLPTIISRVQAITILPITGEQTMKFLLSRVTDERKVRQLMFIASGRPAELTRLIGDEKYFTHLSKLATDARILLEKPVYERICLVQVYAGDREKALELLQTAMLIVRYSMRSVHSSQLLPVADKFATAYDRIRNNGSVRMQLLAAVV